MSHDRSRSFHQALGLSISDTLSATAGETITTSSNDGAVRFVCKPTASTIGNQSVTYSNGSIQITFRLGAAGFEVWDDIAGAQVGQTVSGSFSATGLEIWSEFTTSGRVQCWYRVPSTSELTQWTAGPSRSNR